MRSGSSVASITLTWRQVRSMVFTVTQLQQAVLAHCPITAGRRTIQAHAAGLQVIHPHQLPRQLLLERSPALIVAQVSQDISQSVITQIAHLERAVATGSQSFQAMRCPSPYMIHALDSKPLH